MTIIKCKMCGGDIQRSEDQHYGTCDSCGSTMTFPKVSDEQRANLFNRANHFRRQGEFDKAIAAYESILNGDDADAEAHWGVVLSRYGIEYVEDPASGERVPTCHRVQMDSILIDTDYLAALEHAPDGYSRSLYEEEAKKIAELQRGILALSAQEKPYDVFICYKEASDSGSRTPDSALAQDVYYQLVQEGYRAFFSRITLEDKLGRQYEPYIFAALNSAKVMVVIGTKPEYFNAVWVKNEWSRFLALMKKDRSKLLIPCYKGMDAYDLPEALSMLQSQDMGKIGFIQDLVRGIRKVVDTGKVKPGTEAQAKPVETVAAPGVQSLLTRAQLFLEDGDFKSAAEYADKVLDIDPKYAPAYIARLQAVLGLKGEEELGNAAASLEQYGDYQKAVRFADGKLKAVYLGYNQRILDRLEGERREGIYQAANKQHREASDEAGYRQAAEMFRSIPGFKDADERALASQAKAEESRLARLKREEEERAEQSRREAEREALAYRKLIAAEKRRARNKKTAMIVIPLFVAAVAIALLLSQVVIPKSNYQKAIDLLKSKQYDEAAAAFEVLGGYSDSEEKAQQSIYQKGTDLLADKQYDQAVAVFEVLGNYSDSAVMVSESKYQKAKSFQENGQFDEAIRLFEGLGSYSNASSIVRQAQADKLYAGGDYAGAYLIYNTLNETYRTHDAEYEDMYLTAGQALTQGNYDEAARVFASLGTYRDAAVRVTQAQADKLYVAGDYVGAYGIYSTLEKSYQTHETDYAAMYASAEALLSEGKYDEAAAGFKSIENYSNAEQRVLEAQYFKGEALLAAGKHDDAVQVFTGLGTYRDAAVRVTQAQADKLYVAGDYVGAYGIYSTLEKSYQTHETDYAAMYAAAETALTEEEYDAAIEGFSKIENYHDSADKLLRVRYRYAASLLDSGDEAGAEAVYALIPEYSDVPQRLQALRLKIADGAFQAKEYARALELYLKLPQTDEIKAREYALAQICYEEGAYGVATQAYEILGQYELSLSRLPVARYAYASQLFDQGQFVAAAEQFLLLGGMTDSAVRAKESTYQRGLQLLEREAYDEAKGIFNSMPGYQDAGTQAQEADYRKAAAMKAAGDLTGAGELFESLGSYKDSGSQEQDCRYQLAEAALAAGDYQKAEKFYTALGSYSDSAEKTKLCVYQQAEALMSTGSYAEAEKLYTRVSGYQDSAEKAKGCRLEQGRALYEAEDWHGALRFLDGLEHGDSVMLAAECHYALGESALKAGKTEQAAGEYALAADLPQAQERLYSLGKDYAAVNQTEKAIQVLWAAGDHAPSQTLLMEMGSLLEQGGIKELALMAYLSANHAGDMGGNAEKLVRGVSHEGLSKTLEGFTLLSASVQYAEESNYRYAKSLTNLEEYTRAYEVLAGLLNYKDTVSLIAGNAGLSSAAAAAAEFERKWSVGNTVTFGAYEQDNNQGNGKEPIRWRVLKREGQKALLISVQNLDCQPYNKEWTSVTWETCTLRAWLNGPFVTSAFTPAEQGAILTTAVGNEDNPEYGTDGGNPTQDKVFLLSIAEAETLFRSDKDRVGKNTAYAKAHGAYENDGAGWWWLRSPGSRQINAANVRTDGSVNRLGYYVYRADSAVRPALWLDLASDIVTSEAP